MTADLKWHWVAEEEGVILMTADLEKRVAAEARRLGLTGEYVAKVRPLIELAYTQGVRDGGREEAGDKSDAVSYLGSVPRPAAKKKGEKS